MFLARLNHRSPKSVLKTCKVLSSYFSSNVSGVTLIRHFNPRDDFVENICSQLYNSQPSKYDFLNNDLKKLKVELERNNANDDIIELVSLLNSPESKENKVHLDKCISLFESWIGNSRLNIAYYMFANRNEFYSDEFLTKVVKHLSKNLDTLNTQEIVALWLCLHFSNRVWTKEELFEHLDFTKFQIQFAKLIHTLSVAELTCIFVGMKKVTKLSIYNPNMRDSIYGVISDLLSKYASISPDQRLEQDHLLLLMLRILEFDRLLLRDSALQIMSLVNSFYGAIDKVGIHVLLQILFIQHKFYMNKTQPQIIALMHNAISAKLSEPEILQQLSVSEIKKFVRYLTNMDSSKFDLSAIPHICNHLRQIEDDHNRKLVDVRDMLTIWNMIFNSYQQLDSNFFQKLFISVNENSDAIINNPSSSEKQISQIILKTLHQKLYPESSKNESKLDLEFEQQIYHHVDFINQLVSLNVTMKILLPESRNEIGEINSNICDSLCVKLQNIDKKKMVARTKSASGLAAHNLLQKQQNNVFRKISYLLGDDYISFVRILPHYAEADLVFGHIGGMALSFPEELKGQDLAVKIPPQYGEWVVIALTPVTQSRRKLLFHLGYTHVLDLQHYGGLGNVNVEMLVSKIISGQLDSARSDAERQRPAPFFITTSHDSKKY